MTIPPKAHAILKKTVDDIVESMTDIVAKACDQFPDVDENKVIFLNSVITTVFYQIILMRIEFLDHNEQRRYVKDMITSVQSLLNHTITQGFIDDCNK